MIDLSFVLLFLMIPFVVQHLMKLSGMSLSLFSIPSFVTFSMLFFAYAGILPLYFGWDEYRYYIGIQDQKLVLKIFLFSSWTIITMTLGFVFCRYVLGVKIIQSSTKTRSFHAKESIATYALFLACLIVLALYLSKLQSIALFVAMSNAGGDIGASRSLMGNDFAGKYHWYNLFMRDVLNVVAFSFYANWLVNRKKVGFIIFVAAALAASFSAIMASEKGPFAWCLIGLFLVHVFVVSDGKYPVKSIIKLVFSLLVILVLFYIYFMGSSDVGSALLSILSRVFTGGIAPAYYYLEHFPSMVDFLLGKSLPNPGGLLPFEPYHLTAEASFWIYPDNAIKGIVGSAPTVFWGELYANWGIFGVLLIPFFVGIGVFIISYLVDKLESTPLKVGFIVWLALHLKNLSESGISGFLADTYFVIIFILILLITALANSGRIKYKSFRRCPL